jgi:hypothetical protein
LHRRDDSMRYEAGVDSPQLHQLPAPEGSPGGLRGFNFDLQRYPSL